MGWVCVCALVCRLGYLPRQEDPAKKSACLQNRNREPDEFCFVAAKVGTRRRWVSIAEGRQKYFLARAQRGEASSGTFLTPKGSGRRII